MADCIFLVAVATFSEYKSIPVKFLSSSVQTIPVVPLPIKGSSTQSPFSVAKVTILAIRSSGNIAKCSFP